MLMVRSAIVTSRKRKLRELFAVATHADALPNDGFENPDAPASTPAEWQFLQASDVLQGKTLNELNIPARPRPSPDKLKRSAAAYAGASSAHLSPAPPPCPPENDSATAQNEALASHVSSAKSRGSTPAVAKPTTPVSSAKATPIPRPPQPASRGPPPSPGQPVKASAALAALPGPRTGDGSLGTAQKLNGDAKVNGQAKEGGVGSKRPAQVKFPPGTKASPSADAAKDAHASSETGGPTTNGTDAKADSSSTDARAAGNRRLSMKLPAATAKIPEASSTPGSTAPSVTTPAVHDASTDTSSDNDGARYVEAVETKGLGASDGDKSQGGAVDAQDQGSSAEDQLLQESIRSSVAARDKSEAPAAVPGLALGASTAATAAKLAASEDGSTPAPAASEVQPPPAPALAVQPPARPAPAEVPDSQDEAADEMDVDGPEIKPETEGPKVLASREPSLPAQMAPAGPPAEKPAPPREQPQAPERAVTRVSSGAMRLKSVNEIVGGLSRPPNSTNRDAVTKGAHDQLTPVTSTPQSPASRARNSKRDRGKGPASKVLFGKQPRRVEDKALVPSHKEMIQASDDYYTPLFVHNFIGSSNWMQPLDRILYQANKTISTPDAHLVIQDHQACRVLRRVYHLQQHDKWSLRQPRRGPEAVRPPSQWDTLLQEMKWMRTDFREERKWKMTAARNLAHACAEWHEAGPEARKHLQVAAVIPPKAQPAERDALMIDADEGAENQPTPDLVPSGDMDSPQNVDELVEDFAETIAPSAIFALHEDDVVFGLRRTAASDQLLDELPMYGSPLRVPKCDLASPEYDPDAHWRRPALPLSKYVEGGMILAPSRPPQRRSRYDAANEESPDDDKDDEFVGDQLVHGVKMPPSTDEVSLFHPESKHIRDRLHAGHQFRPPSEYPMPTQSFYECRSPSQWTLAEDSELRLLVREYSYNWSLISTMLSTPSLFAAGAERRTPWECFERWIAFEGLPTDMQKTQYFKAYNGRIEAAQRLIAQHNQLAMQQANASGGAVTAMRRRPNLPVRVERRRNQKHLTMLDAMRKLAKKRETAAQKQQHSASQSAAKKPSDPLPQRPAKTPRDYSLMRWERDQALAEKMAQYAQRQEAQRRAALQARAQAQGAQASGAAGAGAPGQAANHVGVNGVNGVSRPMSSQLAAAAAAAAAAASQGRTRMPMQAPVNGVGVGAVPPPMNGGGLSAPPAQMNGAPPAQMQGVQGQHRMPVPNQQPDASLMLRAQRISEQQRAAVQIQQAQQQQHQQQHQPHQQHQQQQPPPQQQPQQHQQGNNPGTPGAASHNSPPLRNGVNGIGQQNLMNNAQAMMASYTAAAANGNGLATPQANGLHMPSAASASSPGQRMHSQLAPGITAQLNHLEASFRAKNPNLTPEQARQHATDHLMRAMMAQRQNAMHAAAGASGPPGIAGSIAATTSPHQYAALLRQQQQQQQQQQHHLLLQQQQQGQQPKQHQRAPSGSATPSAAGK